MSIAPTDAIPECAVTTENNVHLKFTDGTKTISVPAGTTILEAANAAGVRLVSQCTIGTCGTCVGRVACGDLVMPEGRVYSLRQDEMAAGHRLLCQSHAFAESEVELDYPAAMLDEYPEAFRVRLDVGTGVCVLTKEIGGLTPGAGHEVRMEAVDEPMDDELFRDRRQLRPSLGWSQYPGPT